MLKITKLSDFTLPLKSLKNSVNSVIFSPVGQGTSVNAKSADSSQIINIKWDSKVISQDEKELIGIYNLSEFLTVLEMFGDTEITGNIEDNKLSLKYKSNSAADVKYNLSDISLIQEGPVGPKAKLDFLLTLDLDDKFLKKVKTIASSLNVNVLKFACKGGTVSFSVSDKYFHSHVVSEVLIPKCTAQDFEIFINIEKLNVIPEGKKITLKINEKIIEVTIDEEKLYSLRYFIAPLVITE